MKRIVQKTFSAILGMTMVCGVSCFSNELHAGTISGSVKTATNDPVSGMAVIATGSGYSDLVETNAAGQYSITDLPAGSYRVEVDVEGTDYIKYYYNNTYSISASSPVTVTAAGTVSGIHFVLATGGKISGAVKNEAGTQGLANVTVNAYEPMSGYNVSATTATNGTYVLVGLPTAGYRLKATPSQSADYAREYYKYPDGTYDVNAADLVTVTQPQTTSLIDFYLSLGGTITGEVRKDDNNALFPVWVTAYESLTGVYKTVWATNGAYSITGLIPGPYRVQANPAQGSPYAGEYYKIPYGTYTVNDADLISVVSQGTAAGINLSLALGGSITGTVTKVSDGSALTGLWVTASGAATVVTRGAYSNSSGGYTITGLPEDNFRVQVYPGTTGLLREYYDNRFTFQAADMVAVTLEVTEAGIDFQLSAGGTITGVVVTDGPDPQPLSDLAVVAVEVGSGIAKSADTGNDGAYTIANLAPGSYQVHVETAGTDYGAEYYDDTCDETVATTLVVTEDNIESGVDFALTTERSITGVVMSDEANPQPIAGLEVRASYRDSGVLAGSAVTETDGSYRITGLAPAVYTVNVDCLETNYSGEYYNDRTDETNADPVDVTLWRSAPKIDFELELGGRIEGAVYEVDGVTALAGATIEIVAISAALCAAVQADDILGVAVSEGDGTFIMRGIPATTFFVRASKYEHTTEWWVASASTDDCLLAQSITLSPDGTVSGVDFQLDDDSDMDDDGLPNTIENMLGTDPYYYDSDFDGILDGNEDKNHNGVIEPNRGETNPLDPDSDHDFILDSVEVGLSEPQRGDPIGMFEADADPTTTTNPANRDTDGDGIDDGDEDGNQNGLYEPDPPFNETDPNHCDGCFDPTDLDEDGDVDGEDLALLAEDFWLTGCTTCPGDINGDTEVNEGDLADFADDYGWVSTL